MSRAYRRPTMRAYRYRPHLCKVITLHDHRVLGPALVQELDGRAEVVGDTPYGAVAVELAEFLQPDVVVVAELLADGLIDHFLPDLVRLGCKVLLVVEEAATDRLAELIERGLAGVCTTDTGLAQLARAVLDLTAGGVVVPPQLAATIITQWRSSRRRPGADAERGLSLRELEVLNAMADGLSVKSTARLLGVATKTVENHRTRIFSKLGVRNQAQLVGERVAGRLALLDLDRARDREPEGAAGASRRASTSRAMRAI